MPRPRMYIGECVVKTGISMPPSIKEALTVAAQEQGLSMSQLLTVLAEDWLRRRGYLRDRGELPLPEREPAGVGQ